VVTVLNASEIRQVLFLVFHNVVYSDTFKVWWEIW